MRAKQIAPSNDKKNQMILLMSDRLLWSLLMGHISSHLHTPTSNVYFLKVDVLF